jgi:hypothetical protein
MNPSQSSRLAQSARRCLAVALSALFAAAAIAPVHAHARDDDDDEDSSHAIGLWGDLPCSVLHATVAVPNPIADMNAQRLKLTVHDGDRKAGSNRPCDDNLSYQALRFLNALRSPAMFTPGDNDWTDRHRPCNGGFNSLERLASTASA